MKILIVRLSAIGDVIQGIPCLVALKESFPEWEISWLVEENSAPVLQGHPYLSKLFIIRKDWRKKKNGISPADVVAGAENFWEVRRALRREKFDVAIDLQGLFKSGLWSWLSGAPRRIGHNKTRELAHYFLTEFAGDRPTFDPSFPLIQRYLEPAKILGAKTERPHYVLPLSTKEIIAEADQLLMSSQSLPKIAFCPWSAWPSKNWPIEHWRKLSEALSKNFQIIILGSESDREQANQIAAGNSQVLNLAGKTNLSALAETFRRCQLVVGPDTGPVHLANATGVPKILMLFGSTSWKRSGPLGEKHRSLSTELSCQPCFERICPLGHLNCQKQLETSLVEKTVEEMLKS
jgi:lipopolysaccharide heptosyltransferase I